MDRESIERSLLEVDGACRDINFSEHISQSGATALLGYISRHWTLEQAVDTEGDLIPSCELGSFLSKENGTLSTRWKGATDPRYLQVLLDWPEPDKVFCELTFFPEDLDRERFTLDGFLTLIRALASAAKSNEYYVRYEDATWCHGKPDDSESVILSHESVLAPAGRSPALDTYQPANTWLS